MGASLEKLIFRTKEAKVIFQDPSPWLRHWERFAAKAGLSPAQVKKRILNIAGRFPGLATKSIAVFEAEGNSHVILHQNMTLIEQRCAQTISCLKYGQYK